MDIVSDQGSNKSGREKGLASRLARDHPHIVVLNDLSHIYNNICKRSVKAFPKELINILKCINTRFKRSWKNRAILRRIQVELKMKQTLEVRWLSLTESIQRMLDYENLYKPSLTPMERSKRESISMICKSYTIKIFI